MEITTVSVPLDGSDRAEAALEPAAQLAERCRAEIALLTTPWHDVPLRTVERYLDARVAFTDHPKVRALLVRDRDPVDAICTMAAEDGAIVCMSTRGRSAASAALLGSVSEAVIRRASRPVLLVGPSLLGAWRLRGHPVVIAGIDGSDLSLDALRDAGELAAIVGGRVRAVEVVRPTDVVTRRGPREAATQTVDGVVAELRQAGVRVDSEVVDAFDPADGLVAAAHDRQAAFVSVASRGRSGLARAVLGSVAIGTVRNAPCPVLVRGPAAHRHSKDDH